MIEERRDEDTPTIVAARVSEPEERTGEGYYEANVMVAFSNGHEKRLFKFYTDEMSLTKEELIGLTELEAFGLREKKIQEGLAE